MHRRCAADRRHTLNDERSIFTALPIPAGVSSSVHDTLCSPLHSTPRRVPLAVAQQRWLARNMLQRYSKCGQKERKDFEVLCVVKGLLKGRVLR